MNSNQKCPICNSTASIHPNHNDDSIFYKCPICGRFQLTIEGFRIQNNNQLSLYLFYNRFLSTNIATEYRYHTTLSKEQCDEYRKEFEKGNIGKGRPVHMDNEIINSWYPKSFAERIDRILLHINSRSHHIGQEVTYTEFEKLSLMFVDRKEIDIVRNVVENQSGRWRDRTECELEASYIMDYLVGEGYIQEKNARTYASFQFVITPKGYARIDELQKTTSSGRNVLVAMKFGDDTLPLREAIRKGIEDGGYYADFIDEYQHNEFITPELLRHIRDSKFVVVDLTHQNNGAYFEEGYAMGLGKPVIQLCKEGTKLHFDIAQKNTIMWKEEADIPLKLANRIKATID